MAIPYLFDYKPGMGSSFRNNQTKVDPSYIFYLKIIFSIYHDRYHNKDVIHIIG